MTKWRVNLLPNRVWGNQKSEFTGKKTFRINKGRKKKKWSVREPRVTYKACRDREKEQCYRSRQWRKTTVPQLRLSLFCHLQSSLSLHRTAIIIIIIITEARVSTYTRFQKKSIYMYSTSSGPRYFKVLFSYTIRSAAFAFIGNIQYCVICKIRLFSSSSPNYNPS